MRVALVTLWVGLLIAAAAPDLRAAAPVLSGASAFPNSTKVGLTFDKALEAASAGTAANYKVNGVAVTAALVRTNVANEIGTELNLVQLTVPTALTSDFTVTVTGVKDLAGNAMAATTVPGKLLKLTSTDIGSPAGQPGGPDPQAPSTVTTWGPGAFDVLTTGSNDYWNNADGFNFLWEPKTNSFDVKVRVVSVSPINNWSAGAIEVREGPPTPNGGGWELSRHYFAKVDYGGPARVTVLDNTGTGANSYEFNARLAPGDPEVRETGNGAPGGSVGWGGSGPGNPNPVPFPNAWIRIKRVKSGTSDHLLGYSSSDGVNWSLRQDVDLNDETHAGFLNRDGNPAGPMPDVLYVGLGSTSHTGIGNNNANNDGTVGELPYSPIGQPYSAYIIYRDWGDVVEASPPVLTGASAFPGTTKVGLTFDKGLDADSAGNAANYKVNGVAVTSVLVRTNVANEIGTELNLVQLTVPTALTSDFTVTVTGVKDLAGNAMAATTVPGKLLKLTSTDIGSPAGQPGGPDPQAPSTVTTWGPGAFDVLTTGSNDYWNNADGFNFLWEPKTNSFDVKVRVVSVSPINNWSAGAIEVREGPPTPNGGGWELSRHYFAKVDYGGPNRVTVLDNTGTGADSYEFNARLAPGDPEVRETGNGAPGGSVGWGGSGPGNPNPVPFPNAWIRIARVKDGSSDHLLGYSSSDGVNWSLRQDVDLNDETHAGFLNRDGNPAGPMPDVLYVGLGSTSHTGIGNNNANNDGTVGELPYSPIGQPYSAYIIYRDWGDVAPSTVVTPGRPTLTYQVNADGTVTLTYTGKLYSSETVNGTFTPVTGAANPFTVNPKTAASPITFYIAGP